MQAAAPGDKEEGIEAIRRQIQSEIMGKMKGDRSSGAVARAKAEAEAKAKCAPAVFSTAKTFKASNIHKGHVNGFILGTHQPGGYWTSGTSM